MSEKKITQYILCGLLFCWQAGLFAQFSQEQLQWLESEAEHPTQDVNEGELKFIPGSATIPEHRQTMRIEVTDQTVVSGWATVSQCHENLDHVEKLQIVFHQERVKNLQVTDYQNIEQAWSEGHRVVVRNVQAGSKICLKAESKIFHELEHGGGQPQYEMVNGPFMRRFLDGYYPLTLLLEVHYPGDRLQLIDSQPAIQPGWKIRYDVGRIFLSGRFEGKLITRLRFTLIR